jgi:hypothetical protein
VNLDTSSHATICSPYITQDLDNYEHSFVEDLITKKFSYSATFISTSAENVENTVTYVIGATTSLSNTYSVLGFKVTTVKYDENILSTNSMSKNYKRPLIPSGFHMSNTKNRNNNDDKFIKYV